MESEQMNEFRPLILVAEDDDSNFKLIKAIIGKKCDIEWAKNGQEMVELFQQHQQRAKAMLMDIKMPVILRVLLDVSLLVLLVRLILKRVLSLQSVTFTSHPKMQKNLALRTSRLSALKLVERAESLSSEMLL